MKRHFVTFSRLASVLVLILYLQVIQVTPALAATCTWDNSIGNWSDTTHWSCGAVPGAGDTATIQNGTVTLDVDATVAVLNLRDLGQLDGSSNLTITQAGEWSGSNPKMTGTGKTILAAGAVMTVTGMSAGNGGWFRSFDNYGTLIISGPDGSRLDLASMTLTNKPGGVVDIQSNRYWMQYGGAVFANEGTLLKTTAGWADLGGITLNHSGTLSITTGGLQIASGAWSGAVWLNDAAATLKPNHTDCQLNAGTTFHGPGQVIVGGATLNGDVTLARLVQEGTLTGGGNLTVTQTLDWSGWAAKMEGAGKTTLAAGAVMTLTGNSAGNGGLFRSFDNYGTLIIGGPDGNRLDLASMTLTNKPGGVVDIRSNRPWMQYGGAVFANEGTLLKTTAGWADLGETQVNNTGVMSLTTGGVTLRYSHHNGRVYLNNAEAGVNLEGADNRLSTGAVFSGPGWLYSRGTTLVSGAVTVANLEHANGTLTLGDPTAVNLTVTGEFSRTGGTFQAFNNSTVTFGGTQPRLNLNTVTAFYNLAVLTGTTLIEVNPANHASVNGALVNHGVIRKTQAIAGPGPVLFGLTGVSMTVETAGTLSAVQVDRLDTSHPQASPTAATGRYWRITPTGTGYTVTLTLPHTLTAPVIVMHRYKDGAWNWMFGTTVTTDTITCANLTELSDWAVGTVQRIFIPLVLRNP